MIGSLPSSLSRVFLFLFSLSLICKANLQAQTSLEPCELAIVYADEGAEKFAFVLLTDVASGTQIKFDSNSGLGGDTHTWTSSEPLSSGTVIVRDWDQVKAEGIYAYQGNAICSNVIAEMSMTGWQSEPYEPCNPSGQSIEFNEVQEIWYNGPRSGSTGTLLSALNNTNNFSSSGFFDASTFSVTSSTGGCGNDGESNEPCDDSGSPTALEAGDIAFTAFNSDGNDAIGFAILKDIGAGTTFRISDNDWNGSSISENNYITWTTGCAVPSGTVVFIQDVAATGASGSGATINVGSVTETGTFSLAGADEELWAYQGSAPNLVMLAAISNDNGRLNLANSGLHTGHVVYTSNDEDGFEYNGDRSCVDACLINDITNWANYGGSGGDVIGNVTSMNVPEAPELLFHETFDNTDAFTGEDQFFISHVNTDYFGIWDPAGATDDFGSSQMTGISPSGLPTTFIYKEANGNILMARDLGHNGGSNPSELVWTTNTTGYESCAKIELVMANQAMANGRSVQVSFSTDGVNYSAGTGFNFTGISFWGNDFVHFDAPHEAPVTLPIAETVYVKLSINAPGANEYLGISDFKILGLQSCEDLNSNDICDANEILGCTDPSASNYDPNANVNDGSCAANGCDAADHTIQTGSFYFTPSSLSIAVGESVAWVNEGGVHNVNGNTSTITGQSFGNPEAFSLPTSAGDSGASGGDSGAASQLLNQTLNVNGTSRTYIEYLPAGFDNAQNLPLVLSFHGGSDQAQIQLNQADLRNRADQDGFVLVYPNAIPDPNDGGSTNWQITVSGTLPYTNPNPHSDIDFIDALIDELASSRNIDTTRIYAMGYSNGGGFTFDLACRLNHKITGIGVASRTMYAETYSACNVVHPTPVVTILGTADAESPYEGLTYDGTLYFHGSDEVNNFWINANGLNSTPVVTNVPDINTSDGSTAELYAWSSPDGCHELLHYKVIGGGHDWPGHSGNLDFISHEVIWDALSQHNMNGRIGCGTNTGNTTGSQSPCMGTVTFTVPGVYQYDCSIGSHAAAGMVGTITVGTGGCTNSAASNYNAAADFDDGSCDGVEND